MPSEARQKKIMEKLNRAQKCSILGPQNLGSRGGPPGSAPESRYIDGENRIRTELEWNEKYKDLQIGPKLFVRSTMHEKYTNEQ